MLLLFYEFKTIFAQVLFSTNVFISFAYWFIPLLELFFCVIIKKYSRKSFFKGEFSNLIQEVSYINTYFLFFQKLVVYP